MEDPVRQRATPIRKNWRIICSPYTEAQIKRKHSKLRLLIIAKLIAD
jgi:hypothetical protein